MPDVPLLVVDAANVVGSVPDGWWRDRHGAAVRLRDTLAPLAATGLPGATGPGVAGPGVAGAGVPGLGLPGPEGPVEVVLVVEGAARDVPSRPEVRVVSADGSGDDRIVELVAAEAGRAVWVVTADRELRERVTALGAHVLGPRTVRPRPNPSPQ